MLHFGLHSGRGLRAFEGKRGLRATRRLRFDCDSPDLRGHSSATRRRKLESAGRGLVGPRTWRQGPVRAPQSRKWADEQKENHGQRPKVIPAQPRPRPRARSSQPGPASAKRRRVTLSSREVYRRARPARQAGRAAQLDPPAAAPLTAAEALRALRLEKERTQVE